MSTIAQNFTAGNAVVYRLTGLSSTPLATQGSTAFLEEYSPTGALIQTVEMPTSPSGVNRKFAGVNNSPDGIITRSQDKRYIVIPGYEAEEGDPGVTTGSGATYVNRIIGTVRYDKVINTSLALTEAQYGINNVIRSAATVDGTAFWISGSNNVVYNNGATNTVINTKNGFYGARIFNNQLYFAYRASNDDIPNSVSCPICTGDGTGDGKVVKLGSGLPTSASAQIEIGNAPNGIAPSNSGFPIVSLFFADLSSSIPGPDVLYIAEESSGSGGVSKFSFNGTTWASNGKITGVNIQGVDGYVTGTSVRLYATSQFGLFTFVDNGGYNVNIAPSSSFGTAIAEPTTNSVFKSVCLAPEGPSLVTPIIINVNNKCNTDATAKGKLTNPPVGATVSVKLDGNAITYNTVDSTFTYFVNGSTAAGNHTVTATYTLGTITTQKDSIFIVSNQVTPTVSISATGGTIICNGTSAAFTATPTNGGTTPTYQWKVNGANVGTNAATYSSTTLANNDVVTVVMTSNAICPSSTTVTSNSLTMIVNPSVTPSVSISATGGTTICNGTSVAFTATPTNGGTTPTYQWKVNGNNVGTNAATYSSTTLANNDVVTVVMTSNATCPSSTTVTSNSLTMIVNPSVTPSVSISATGGTTICNGTSVAFTATPTNGGTTPTYQWKVNGTNVGTNAATYSSNTLVNNDVVTVVMTSNATCRSSTTVTSNSLTMTVSASVTPTVSINATGGTTICNGTSVAFTATPTNGGTTPTYQWKVNGTNVGTNAATYSSTTLANNDVVTVVMTSSATCASPAMATSNILTMTVNAVVIPTVSINATGGTTICSGTSVAFTATPTNGGTTPTYQWKVNGTNVGTNVATYSSTTLGNNDVVTVVMTSNAVCPSSTSVTSNSLTMTVNTTVTPTVSINTPNTTICNSTSVTFTATPTNGGTTPTYQWKVGSTNVGTNSPTYTTTTLTNGNVVTVVMTSNAACATTTTATSNAVTITVNATVTPSVSISTPNTTVCNGASVTFMATPTNGGTTPTYQWKVNGTNAIGATAATFATGSLANNDVVTVTMTSNATCPSPTTATSTGITMTVTPSVTPFISISGTTTVTAGQSSSISSLVNNGGTTPIYQWQQNTTGTWVDISGATMPTLSYTPAATGNKLRCRLTSNATCAAPTIVTSGELTFTVSPVTAINPVVRYGLRIFPIPASNFITIDKLAAQDKWLTASLISLDGKHKINITSLQGLPRVEIPLKNVQAGSYILHIHRADNKDLYIKIIKE